MEWNPWAKCGFFEKRTIKYWTAREVFGLSEPKVDEPDWKAIDKMINGLSTGDKVEDVIVKQAIAMAEYQAKSKGGALDTQVGGNHYKSMAIQPTEYSQKNGLGWCEGNIVKYASRHRNKNGAEDVKKIIHYAQLLLEFEYGEEA